MLVTKTGCQEDEFLCANETSTYGVAGNEKIFFSFSRSYDNNPTPKGT